MAASTRPRRRLLWWLAVPAAALILVFSWRQGRHALAEAELQTYLAELSARDPGWELESILAQRPARTPAQQAALERLLSLRPPLEWSRPDRGDLPKITRFSIPSPVLLARDDWLDCQQRLEKLGAEWLDQLRDLADAPPGHDPLTPSDEPGSLLARRPQNAAALELALILCVDARLQACVEQVDRAVRSIRGTLGLARQIGDEPFLADQLTRLATAGFGVQAAEYTLALATPPPTALARLQADFQREEARYGDGLVPAWRTERALVDRKFRVMTEGGWTSLEIANFIQGPPHTITGDDQLDELFHVQKSWGKLGQYPTERLALLKFLTSIVPIVALPPAQGRPQLRERMEALAQESILTRKLCPAVEETLISWWRQRTYLRTAMVGLAAERFRQERGAWPGQLTELVPDYLPSLPEDPFTGQALRLGQRPDGITIYSTGPDNADQGGRRRATEAGPGDDISFRLWHPQFRRQTPAGAPADRARGEAESAASSP